MVWQLQKGHGPNLTVCEWRILLDPFTRQLQANCRACWPPGFDKRSCAQEHIHSRCLVFASSWHLGDRLTCRHHCHHHQQQQLLLLQNHYSIPLGIWGVGLGEPKRRDTRPHPTTEWLKAPYKMFFIFFLFKEKHLKTIV